MVPPSLYAIGLEWEEPVFPVEAVAGEPPRDSHPAAEGIERRRWPRAPASGEWILEHGVTSSVVVLDISASGVLVASAIPLPNGTRGELRMRLGGADFVSDVTVCRGSPEDEPKKGWRLGSKFDALDERSRASLNTLLEGRRGTA